MNKNEEQELSLKIAKEALDWAEKEIEKLTQEELVRVAYQIEIGDDAHYTDPVFELAIQLSVDSKLEDRLKIADDEISNAKYNEIKESAETNTYELIEELKEHYNRQGVANELLNQITVLGIQYELFKIKGRDKRCEVVTIMKTILEKEFQETLVTITSKLDPVIN